VLATCSALSRAAGGAGAPVHSPSASAIATIKKRCRRGGGMGLRIFNAKSRPGRRTMPHALVWRLLVEPGASAGCASQ
jgi:hypothetical protein